MKNTITFEFKTEESKHNFIAWLLDGGGDNYYQDFLDMHDKDFTSLKQKKDSWDEIIVK